MHAHPQRSETIRRLAEEILAAHSTLILSDDTLACAKHAAEKGWISPTALPFIAEEKKGDQGITDQKVGQTDSAFETTTTVVVGEDPAAQAARTPE